MILQNGELTSAQLHHLKKLQAICLQEDGGLPNLYVPLLSKKRAIEANFLYYQEENLIGFAAAYFFYPDACEITMLIMPSQRKQGIGKVLLKQVLSFIASFHLEKLIFSTGNKHLQGWLSALGFSYYISEYHMQRRLQAKDLPPSSLLSIRPAILQDIPLLCKIDEACFPNNQAPMEQRFTQLLADSEYTILVALLQDKLVGKAHINWLAEYAYLSDIAVLPAYQQQGFGGNILDYGIYWALQKRYNLLALDVETSNKKALNIYLQHGFLILHTTEYWTITPKALNAYLFP